MGERTEEEQKLACPDCAGQGFTHWTQQEKDADGQEMTVVIPVECGRCGGDGF